MSFGIRFLRLAKQYPPSKIRVLFGVSNQQYQKRFKQFYPQETLDAPPEIDLCEVKTQSSSYRSFNIPASNTVIVEFVRKENGQIMRIHTTTDHFQRLIQAFFAGGYDAANHR